MTVFSDYSLGAPLLQAIAQSGYSAPTPIQAQAIPPVLSGRDLCGIAQTGTGKTAAFALPILSNLFAKGGAGERTPKTPRVLVLAPTRELASQIDQSFRTYGARLPLKSAVIFGGVSQRPQVDALKRGVDVLVATPGRLLDLMEQRAVNLGKIEVLVVDEADQMLDLGFIVPLKRIVKQLPAKRQTLFFSATMPKTIAELADSLLSDPVQVAVTPVATTVERVDQSVLFVASEQKPALLERLLADPNMERVLVFTRTKHGADKVVRNLAKAGVNALAIHGNKSQAQRERALASFKSGAARVLVATDIAARGIHVENVSHVINYELPNIPESYVHRIGRTARAGAAGIAISFCNGEERAFLRDIEKLTRSKVPVAALPEGIDAGRERAPATEPPKPQPQRQGRRPAKAAQRPSSSSRPAQGERTRQPRQERPSQERTQQNRPRQERPRQERSGQERSGEGRSGGLDASGLPMFLTRPQRRDGATRA